jgi:RNA polymerase sigma-70 factor (ECF subfamily)
LNQNTSNSIDENKLIELSQKGDRKALAQLVKLYEQTVYNFAFKICRNREKAEHVMQETFLSMVKSISQFSGKSKLSTWLYTVVSNHCLMLARSEKRREASEFEEESTYSDAISSSDWKFTPSDVTENNELKEVLDRVIERLPEDYKIVFMLRDVEGLSTAETAEIMNLTVPAVKSRLHRARAFLRNELNKELKDGN